MNAEIVQGVLADLGLSWWQAGLVAVGAATVAAKGAIASWRAGRWALGGALSLAGGLLPKPSELARKVIDEVRNCDAAVAEGLTLKCRKVTVRVDSNAAPFRVTIHGRDDATPHLTGRDQAAIDRAARARLAAITAGESEGMRQILIESLRD